ncbi:MAG: RNA polymerase sigma factor [Lachnospiraceae bacterium]|nr:RNA polymerase sigma factor [Lachnospiraceae bacterium]
MERDRFIQLIQAEQISLRNYLLGLCRGDSVEADDIFQEAMTRAYLASPSFFERARPGAWLLRICYNCFIDHIRSSKHHDTYGLEMAENVPDKRTADESFRFEAIWQAVCNLPEKERSCILLFYKEDLSIKDISSIMGIPIGSVKAYLSRGRRSLKEYLKNDQTKG